MKTHYCPLAQWMQSHFTLCGKQSQRALDSSNEWSQVTCKSCQRKRPNTIPVGTELGEREEAK